MDIDKLRNQIDALLNTAGCTAEEAETRKKMAERILARHNMTVDQLKADAKILDDFLAADRVETIMMKWVAGSIGRLTRTKDWMRKRFSPKSGRVTNGKEFHFTGYAPDAEWANWLARSLCNQLKVETSSIKDWRAKEDFALAFGIRVKERMDALADSMEEQHLSTTTENALIADDMLAINQYLKEELGLTFRASRGRGKNISSWDSFDRGQKAGDRASFGRPVGEGSGPIRIGYS